MNYKGDKALTQQAKLLEELIDHYRRSLSELITSGYGILPEEINKLTNGLYHLLDVHKHKMSEIDYVTLKGN